MDVHRSPAWLGGSGLRSGTEPHGVRELPACVLHLGCAVPLGGAAGAVDREAETARAAAAAGVRHLRTGGGLSPSSSSCSASDPEVGCGPPSNRCPYRKPKTADRDRESADTRSR